MDFMNFSETLKAFLPAVLIALLCTMAGSRWIDFLYTQSQSLHQDLLSFPEQIEKRTKLRKPLLFLLLTFCIARAWTVSAFPVLIYVIFAIIFLCFVTVTDFEQYVIFDAMLLPFAMIGILYTIHMQLPLMNHIAAGLGGGLLFFLLTLLTKGAIGGGDIKLIAALGLWLGIRPLLSVIAYGFVAGGVAALFLLVTRQKSRHSYFAYGPYFALSAVGMLLGVLKGMS